MVYRKGLKKYDSEEGRGVSPTSHLPIGLVAYFREYTTSIQKSPGSNCPGIKT